MSPLICPGCQTVVEGKMVHGTTIQCGQCGETIFIVEARDHSHGPVGALILSSNAAVAPVCQRAVEQLGFQAQLISSLSQVRSRLGHSSHTLVLVDASFQSLKGVWQTFNAMDMSERRDICLVFIQKKYKTGDFAASLAHSINYMVHVSDLKALPGILSRVLGEQNVFYSTYKRTLEIVGKA